MTFICFGILSLFDHFIIIPPRADQRILPGDTSLENVVDDDKLFHKQSLVPEAFVKLKAGSEGAKRLTVGSK